MTQWTHITQLNGANRGPLVDSVRPFPDQIRLSLTNLDGTSKWAYSLWRAPEGADLRKSIPFSDEYLQCAGSADALTIEARRLDAMGIAHHYVVGKPGGDVSGEPTAEVRWDDGRHSVTVHPNEVFTADEAADVFYAYFLTDKVSEPYTLRELDLSVPRAADDR